MSPLAALRFVILFAPILLAACTPPPSRVAAGPQVASDCRARADAVYDKQNRQDLSRRDQRDSPFSASYNSGITSRGLGARFERDRMVANCVAANSGSRSPAASTGPTFSGQVPY